MSRCALAPAAAIRAANLLAATLIAASSLAASLLAGCAPDYSPNTYSTAAVQQANKVEQGTVVGVRPVDVTSQGVTGAVTGAAAGGIVGSQTPGGGFGSAFGALGGSVIGGLVGTAAEKTTGDTKAFEYIVRKGNGELVSVTQKDDAPLAVGSRVLVIAGNQARIVPDYTVQADPQGAPGADQQAKAASSPTRPEPARPEPTNPVVAPAPAVQAETLPPPSPPTPPAATEPAATAPP